MASSPGGGIGLFTELVIPGIRVGTKPFFEFSDGVQGFFGLRNSLPNFSSMHPNGDKVKSTVN